MNRKMNLQKNTETGKSKKTAIILNYAKIFGVPILKTSFPEKNIKELIQITDVILKDKDSVDHSKKLAGVIKKGQQVLLPHKHNKDPEKDRTIKVFRKKYSKVV